MSMVTLLTGQKSIKINFTFKREREREREWELTVRLLSVDESSRQISELFKIWNQKYLRTALARWLSWLEHHSTLQKVVGSIPGQGTFPGCWFSPWSGRVEEATDPCFSLTSMFLFPLSSLSQISKHILWWRLK